MLRLMMLAVLDPLLLDGQLHGGIVQGVGHVEDVQDPSQGS